LVVDLCVSRNVDPAVTAVAGVRLVDLAGLRLAGAVEDDSVTRDVARAEDIVDAEADRYLRWLAGRAAAASVRRLRADVDARTREHVDHATRGLPDEIRPLVADRVRRVVLQLAHGPTVRLLAAAEEGDDRIVEAMAAVFAEVATAQ
jgi:glutamyl-tRNA reductase